MRKRFGLAIATALLALALIAAPGASAATEVGNDCLAEGGGPGATFVQLDKAPGSPLPISAPAGVVTKWKVNSGVEVPVSQQLLILRPTGGANEFQTVAESASATVVTGSNSFDTRIPVQAGDRLGASAGSPGGAIPAPLYCVTGDTADVFGIFAGEPALGSINTFSPTPGGLAAISAIVEPDADGDEYGDETQDKCPQSKAVQTECPIVSLSSFGLAQKGSALILVTASSSASVTVTGTVSLPPKKGKKGKGKAGKSAIASITVGPQAVAPGQIGSFTLKLPAGVKAALRALPPKRSLTLTATASATDVAGRPSSSTVKVKLPGTALKPKGKAKAKGKPKG